MPVYLLIDNGSKKPEATLRLRGIAENLSTLASVNVHAVSLQHADAIDKKHLNNIPANTFYPFLKQQLESGEREFIVLPLFFGLSRALTSFIPEQVSVLEQEYGSFTLKLADVIYPLPGGDPRLADIVYRNITTVADTPNLSSKKIVLVDHGSPVPQITEVRKQVAIHLQTLLGEEVELGQAVMERRAGEAYDFNGPLLEEWLKEQAKKGIIEIIVAMMFFLPGRHAGECGDIEEICDNIVKDFPALQIMITPLISEQDLLLSILHDRLLSAVKN